MKKTMCERGRKPGSGSKAKIRKYASLVRNPRFVCLECGRVAADGELLCRPAAIGTGKKK